MLIVKLRDAFVFNYTRGVVNAHAKLQVLCTRLLIIIDTELEYVKQ